MTKAGPLEIDGYRLNNPDGLATPAMVVFESWVDFNIKALCDMVGGGGNLMVHVKTHKSLDVTRKQIESGVAGFKCATLREVEMVLQAGAREVILAYPITQMCKAERFVRLCQAHPQTLIHAVVSAPEHVALLGTVARQHQQPIGAMLDVDAGMHRTGVAPDGRSQRICHLLKEHPLLELSGLHVYDGHDHETDEAQRQRKALVHIEDVKNLRDQLAADGFTELKIVGGGTYSFPYYARQDGMYGSPGTTIYWSAGCQRKLSDMPFRCAAMVLTQVVDRHPDQGTITTDLGHKAVAGDVDLADRADLLGRPDARLVLQNEEHGVFALDDPRPQIGDYLLAVPGHVCPTTVHYPGSHVIDDRGNVCGYWEHTARDR